MGRFGNYDSQVFKFEDGSNGIVREGRVSKESLGKNRDLEKFVVRPE